MDIMRIKARMACCLTLELVEDRIQRIKISGVVINFGFGRYPTVIRRFEFPHLAAMIMSHRTRYR
jgi:hypothetical protein